MIYPNKHLIRLLLLLLLCHTPIAKPQLNAGDLDPTFGINGKMISPFPLLTGNKKVTGVMINADGTFFAAGTSTNNADTNAPHTTSLVARYNHTGALDTTFNFGQGFAALPSFITHAIARGQDNNIVIAGASQRFLPITMAVRSFLSNGLLAPLSSFDNTTILPIFFNFDGSEAYAATTDLEDRIITAGYGLSLDNTSLALARVLPNGIPDNAFGVGGTTFLSVGNGPKRNERINGIAIDVRPNTRHSYTLYTAGFATMLDNSIRFIVAAFNEQGIPEARFSTQSRIPGVAEANFGSLMGGLQAQESRATAVALQEDTNGDTKIVAAGYVSTHPNAPDRYAVALVRYNSNGTLDSSFGQIVVGSQFGMRLDAFGAYSVKAHALAIDSNRNIIVVGQLKSSHKSPNQFLVARYTPDGERDAEFGNNGVVITPFVSYDAIATAVAIDENDDILVGGLSTDATGVTNFAFARYNGIPEPQPELGKPGTLDITFNQTGMVIADTAGTINGIAIHDNGNIFIAGTQTPIPDTIQPGVSTIRSYLSTGLPNNGFSPFMLGGRSFLSSLILHPNGTLIASGFAVTQAGETNLILYSVLSSTGQFNPEFAGNMGNGYFFPPPKSLSVGRALAAYPLNVPTLGGRIVAAGYTEPSSTIRHFALTRTLARPGSTPDLNDGKHDDSFGLGGMLSVNFSNSLNDFSQINGVALYPPSHQNKIIVAGQALIDNQQRFVLARFQSTGAPDTTFGALVDPRNPTGPRTGKVVTDFSQITLVRNRNDRANAVALQRFGSDIKIVAVGTTPQKDGKPFVVLARYNDNGTLDTTSFGYKNLGIRISCFGAQSARADALVIDESNRILIAGTALRPAPVEPTTAEPVEQFFVARYKENGTIDPLFGADGKTFTHFLGLGAGARSLALQPDGKIVLGGFAVNDVGQRMFAMARYHA